MLTPKNELQSICIKSPISHSIICASKHVLHQCSSLTVTVTQLPIMIMFLSLHLLLDFNSMQTNRSKSSFQMIQAHCQLLPVQQRSGTNHQISPATSPNSQPRGEQHVKSCHTYTFCLILALKRFWLVHWCCCCWPGDVLFQYAFISHTQVNQQ